MNQTLLKELLDYDEVTGLLTWKPRTSKHIEKNQVLKAGTLETSVML